MSFTVTSLICAWYACSLLAASLPTPTTTTWVSGPWRPVVVCASRNPMSCSLTGLEPPSANEAMRCGNPLDLQGSWRQTSATASRLSMAVMGAPLQEVRLERPTTSGGVATTIASPNGAWVWQMSEQTTGLVGTVRVRAESMHGCVVDVRMTR